MLTHAEITEILNREVSYANSRLTDARLKVNSITSEVPGALPQPDGNHRIAIAMRERDSARDALLHAVKRTCNFTLYGIVPEELKEPGSNIGEDTDNDADAKTRKFRN